MRTVLCIPLLNPADNGRGFCQRHADFHINLWHRNAATEELVDVTGNIGEVAKAGDGTKLLAAFALNLCVAVHVRQRLVDGVIKTVVSFALMFHHLTPLRFITLTLLVTRLMGVPYVHQVVINKPPGFA